MGAERFLDGNKVGLYFIGDWIELALFLGDFC